MLNTNHIVILGGGVGSRLKGGLPKQFLLVAGRPILMHTIEVFHHSKISFNIILVLHKEYVHYWDSLCERYHFHIPHQIVEGGCERFYSVKNGLSVLPQCGFVGIHDGVRPFVTQRVITDVFETARQLGNASPAVKATNPIRFVEDNQYARHVDRKDVYVMQNPQVFKIQEIKTAYNIAFDSKFVDDASVAELSGIKINLVEGDYRNIKITHPSDLAVANALYEYNIQTMYV